MPNSKKPSLKKTPTPNKTVKEEPKSKWKLYEYKVVVIKQYEDSYRVIARVNEEDGQTEFLFNTMDNLDHGSFNASTVGTKMYKIGPAGDEVPPEVLDRIGLRREDLINGVQTRRKIRNENTEV